MRADDCLVSRLPPGAPHGRSIIRRGRCICAPKDTPAEIVDKLNVEINAGLADPRIKARLADLGATPFVGSPGDFHKLVADETEEWGKVIKFAGLKPQ